MRYCGYCGAALPASVLGGVGDNGDIRCPSCGAIIGASDDIVLAGGAGGAGEPFPPPPVVPDGASLSALPTWPQIGRADPRTRIVTTRRVSGRVLAVVALAALALLLVGSSALLFSNATGRIHLPGLAAGDAASAQETATSSAAHLTPTDGAHSGPVSSPGGSPAAGTPAAGTPSPDATTTTTPDPGQPVLAVTPTTPNVVVCLGSSIKLTVTNTGGGVLAWSASASPSAYKVSPQSGSLNGSQQQTVTVSNISARGTVTFAAPGAANAPQTVTISCTL